MNKVLALIEECPYLRSFIGKALQLIFGNKMCDRNRLKMKELLNSALS